MPRHALLFFLFAALFGLLGAATGIFTHFSVLGFATLSSMGAFYSLAKRSRLRTLPWINLIFSTSGAGLYALIWANMTIGAQGPIWVLIGKLAAVLVALGIATFGLSVTLALVREPRS